MYINTANSAKHVCMRIEKYNIFQLKTLNMFTV